MIVTENILTYLLGLTSIIFFSSDTYAQKQVAKPPFTIISLTTQNSVKLEVALDGAAFSNTKFAVKIIDDRSGKIVFDQPVTSSGKEENKLLFIIKDLTVDSWTPTNPILYRLVFSASGNNPMIEQTNA